MCRQDGITAIRCTPTAAPKWLRPRPHPPSGILISQQGDCDKLPVGVSGSSGSTNAGTSYIYCDQSSQHSLHHLSLWLCYSLLPGQWFSFDCTWESLGSLKYHCRATPHTKSVITSVWDPGLSVVKEQPRLRISTLGPAGSLYDHCILFI